MKVIAESTYSKERMEAIWSWAKQLSREGWNVEIKDGQNSRNQAVTTLLATKEENTHDPR